ncbi:hypothetical protein [Streptomyces griseoruber]|uniref:hypothetical protein n=1 Tax=Streptomyces griseoruber TaxID=1943 RepID=UPI0037985496
MASARSVYVCDPAAHAAQTLGLLNWRFIRSRAYYSALLAELQLAQDEHDKALATAPSARVDVMTSGCIAARLEQVTESSRSQGGRT